MVNYDKRAYRYVTRKRKKSILLGIIFMVAILVGSLGTILLQSFDATIGQIGQQSQAKIILSITDAEQLILDEHISNLADAENISFLNRINETTSFLQGFEIGVGYNENLEDAKVRLQGFDDLARGSLFAREVTVLTEGTLDVGENGVILHEMLAQSNEVNVGDTIVFQNENNNEITAKIQGLYTYADPLMENERHALSMFRFENLIFAHPVLVNQIQNEGGYIEAHFYVTDPRIIQEVRQTFEEIIRESSLETRISDVLFQRLSTPLLQTANLVTMIIIITGVVTAIVISLLLILWSLERKKEVALLLSMGESKLAIFMQRFLEVVIIYLVSFFIVVILSMFIYPTITEMVQVEGLEWQKISINEPGFSVQDTIRIFMIGIITLIITVSISCISVLRLKPKKVFSSID